ncbi:MAG: PH domain-containing protein [Candidatus Magasanikbacteria bacterium]|nr:PH domain-containing protein [Candidatus Magasanikbacteria bacterium]MCA9389264.1 PH domain-containing protein [Candidatus Magasanikbacteria bacterium]MCA9390767.1 PH domain-containing protein [Candidatus Magasanikbacteria bacterium]USN52527.1 MAG: PH domain-containing protein [Candidatus Nomurabacteria bacterium]HPF95597.1 PH domain-containing protein [bacterium]
MLHLKHLPNEIPKEKVVHILRRHPITILSTLIGYAVIIAFPFVVAWYLNIFEPTLYLSSLYQPLIILGVSAVFFIGWLMLFLSFLDYYLDVWIVTTKRILNIEQIGLFARVVSEVRLHRIQDVTSSVKGFWATMFNYGKLDVQTAGEKLIISFEDIPNPIRISKSVTELSELDRRSQLDEAVQDFSFPQTDTPEHHPSTSRPS